MPVYQVTPLYSNAQSIDDAIKSIINDTDRHQLQAERGWLVAFPGTTMELSNHIGLTGQPEGAPSPLGSALVVPVTNYYGRGPADMWEWLKTRLEK